MPVQRVNHIRHLPAILLSILLFFACQPPAGTAQSLDINLSDDQSQWLQDHPRLRVQLAVDWPPYNYVENGSPQGFVNDYIQLLAEKLGVEVEFVSGQNWSEYVDMLADNKLDCITNMTITPERKKRFLFSEKSVVNVFNGLLTLKENSDRADLEKLRGTTLAVARGYAQQELLKRYYPDIKLLPTENLLEAVRQVMAGRAFAAIGAHAVFNYYIAEHLLGEVSSVPITGNIIFPSAPHHIAVHPDNAALLALLDKAAAAVSEEERQLLREKWHLRRPQQNGLMLSGEEQDYLTRKNQLSICADPDWMPLESITGGRHVGMAADYLRLVAKRLGLSLELVPSPSWKQTLDFAQNRQCDLITLAMSTPERRLYLHFTTPYFTTPLVVATEDSTPFIADFGALRNRSLGYTKNYAFGPLLQEKHDHLAFVEAESLEQGLSMVLEGQLFAFIDSLPTLAYTLQHYPGELKIAGDTGETLELRMGVRNDEPLLLSAVNKAIESIREEEHQEILNRWISVEYEEGTDYGLIVRLALAAAVIFILLFYRQVTLKKLNSRLQRRNTEITRQSELLKKTQEQLLVTQYAVDSCSFPIFWLQLHHDHSRIVHANEAAAAGLGYDLQEFLQLDPQSINLSLATPTTTAFTAPRQQTPSSPISTVFRRRDGSTFPVELHSSFFTYKDQRFLFMFFMDISKQKEMEAKLHRSMKMEAVGMTAGSVAHDLNNILCGIVSYPELLLLELADDHPIRPQLEAIKKSGEQAAEIVDDLLTMARGAAAVRQTVHLNAIILSYFDSPEFKSLQERFPRVRCSLQLDPHLKNSHCSPLHVRKSIMNLVINGYEAAPEGGTVRLSTFNLEITASAEDHQYVNPGEYVAFEVEDSGPGVSAESMAHIFEPFYSKKQLGKSGTGLGLSIVWNTAQDHDGSVTVSNGDRGAIFRLLLPATMAEISGGEDEKIDEELQGSGEKILIIDDEERQLDIASRILRTLGYTPHVASSGEEALLRIDENFDLVLLDMLMSPGMGGKKTYAAILERQPRQKAIIVSGFSEDTEVRQTLAMGAARFVRKPYSLYRLGAAVRDALR